MKGLKDALFEIESRFIKVTGYGEQLSTFPLSATKGFSLNRKKATEFAEVFTPVHIVDKMLGLVPEMTPATKNLDLCAGQGQFTIRMFRKLLQENPGMDVKKYLRENHFLSEIQLDSCYKLLKIFGCDINLAIGDALQLGKLPVDWRGIWVWVDQIKHWVNADRFVRGLYLNTPSGEQFVQALDFYINHHKRICKEYQMDIKHMVETKEGREILARIVRDSAEVEENWQDVKTPEWVVKEMCRLIPDLKEQKKILVLFNIEFLECLVKDCGVRASRIEFGSDSKIEEALAKKVYNVHTFSIGKNLEDMKGALNDKAGRYDVVFSNPPYQEMDEGYGASAKPLYHKIVMYVIDVLKPHYISMITPSRWMAGGKGLDDYRARMLKDKRLRVIQDFPGNAEVFKTVSIQGGVSYFLWDRDYNGPCEFNGIPRDIGEFDVLVRNNTSAQILKKVLAKHTGKTFCNQVVKPSKPFGLRTFFNDWVPDGTPGAVHCYTNLKGDVKFTMPQNIVDLHGVLGKWKVLTSSANGAGQECDDTGAKSVLANTIITKPAEACTETLIVAGAFNTKKEAVNYSDYMKTKFYRFMLSLRTITQHITQEKFAWVPDMGDYTLVYTDQDLYQHFGLTTKEIEHIENTIRAL